MIPFLIGVLILIAIFGFIWFVRTKKDKTSKTTEELTQVSFSTSSFKEIKEEDIVLALLTESGATQLDSPYAILWNGKPGKTYEYAITENGIEIAKGSATSKSSVYKIRGLPLEQNKIYDVRVGETDVRIPFAPPLVSGVAPIGDELDVSTNIVPTNIEILVSSVKVPLSGCQIKIEPPGFICKLPPHPPETKPVMVIYNGPNAVTILM